MSLLLNVNNLILIKEIQQIYEWILIKMLMYVSASNIQKKFINKDDINKSTDAKTSGWIERKEHVPFNKMIQKY